MTLHLTITGKKIELSAEEDGQELGRSTWNDENNLGEKFFVEMDSLLEKMGKTRRDIVKMEYTSDEPAGFTTTRIAETIAKSMNYAIEAQEQK